MLPKHRVVAAVGVGSTAIARHSDISLGRLAVSAAVQAIADAGLRREDIDGYVGSPNAPNASAAHADGLDEVSSSFMATALGLKSAKWCVDVDGMATGMVVAAAQALISGTCKYVVAVRALYNPDDRKYSQLNVRTAGGSTQFTLPYGLGPGGGRFALMLGRYMHDFGATRTDLFEIIRMAHANAKLNPIAVARDRSELTLDQYLNARRIFEPMCLFDVDMPVTGAAAVVFTTADRARDLPNRPAYLVSYANRSNPKHIFDETGIRPTDVTVAQIYDGYSVMVWDSLELLGFCKRGEAFQFANGSRINLRGQLPLNTFGGSLGEGRLHGMGHLREAVLQVMGRAHERQVPNVEYSLVHVGIPERAWTLLFSPKLNGD